MRFRWLIPAAAAVAVVAIVIANRPQAQISVTAHAHPPPQELIGCTLGSDPVVRHAPRTVGKRVALTFDDGPSEYTPAVLRILRDAGVNATFFVVGNNIVGRDWMLRRMLEDGDEIGNHTMTHTPLANIEDIGTASATIEQVTGFRPCHFRPPEGVFDHHTLDEVGELGMTTVRWDVDTQDYSGLPADSIRQEVLSAVQPGSIILLHDGGGYRTPTVQALPHIIEDLKRRGYRLVTVTDLLGEQFRRGQLRAADAGAPAR
jgi:peptidoglycan/xylan/chitin deacetylase (PgdA/CDA1 family)